MRFAGREFVTLFNCFHEFTIFKSRHAFDLPESAKTCKMAKKRIGYIGHRHGDLVQYFHINCIFHLALL